MILSHLVEDVERNDGKERPYFMDPELQKVMNIQNTPVHHDDKAHHIDEEKEEAPLIN